MSRFLATPRPAVALVLAAALAATPSVAHATPTTGAAPGTTAPDVITRVVPPDAGVADGTTSDGATDGDATTPSVPEPDERTPDTFAARLGGGRIVSGLAAHRALHFTFDDGPGEHTHALLDTLEAHGVHATFFLVARQLESSRGRRMAREIADRGHTIGLHSYRHDDLTTLDTPAIRRDLDRAERVYQDVFGARPWLFRPPYGRHDAALDTELAARGYTEVLWNITATDGSARSSDAVVEGFRAALDRQEQMPRGAGGVVIFHDTHRWIVDAMPAIFAELEARNCALLAEDAELWDIHDDLGAWHEARGHAAATRSAARMHLDDEALETRQGALRERTAAQCEVDPS